MYLNRDSVIYIYQVYANNSMQFSGPPAFEEEDQSGAGSNVDITSAVTQRLSAMKRLQENPNDTEAMMEMNKAQQEVQLTIFFLIIFGHSLGIHYY